MDNRPHSPWWSRALRQLRRRFDLSQRQLADLAGLSPSTIGDLEVGRTVPRLVTLEKALAAVGFYLDVSDAAGDELPWSSADDSHPRDEAGRRYPAHLDVRPRYPHRVKVPGESPTPSILCPEWPWTYTLCRYTRDRRRLGGDFGVWGAGPPIPGHFDAEYVRDVLGVDATRRLAITPTPPGWISVRAFSRAPGALARHSP